MPEGDTIHKTAATMRPRLAGQTVRRLETNGRAGVGSSADRLLGRAVKTVDAHGKHLLMHFDNQRVLRSHLGMYGSWHRYAHGESWRKPVHQASLVIGTDTDVFVCFNAGEIEVLGTSQIRVSNLFQRLGDDLLGADFDARVAAARARAFNADNAALCDVLLDQRAACGIGNVYKCEVLFLCRLHPRAALRRVGDSALVEAYELAHELLGANLGNGPRVTRLARPKASERVWVYGRNGDPCHECAQPIQYERFGRNWRPNYWCQTCQSIALLPSPKS